MRLIDADALSDALFEKRKNYPQWVAETIGGMPTIDVDSLLKEQEIEEPHPWEHIWDAPDYTFKGRCRNCGLVHYFIQGHDAQYRFCPQCGEQKVI